MSAAATVVLVGDDPDVVLLCRAILEAEGFAVLEAPEAAAFDRVRDAAPDVVLVHAEHRESGSADVLARLATDPRTRDVRVVLLTGEVEDGGPDRAWRSGATEVVTASTSPSELARVMADVLATTSPEAAQRRRLTLDQLADPNRQR